MIDQIKRIRYTTSHPINVTADLIKAHADLPKLMPYLHLPLQSGSNKILKAMNRKHDRDFYLTIIQDPYPPLNHSPDFCDSNQIDAHMSTFISCMDMGEINDTFHKNGNDNSSIKKEHDLFN